MLEHGNTPFAPTINTALATEKRAISQMVRKEIDFPAICPQIPANVPQFTAETARDFAKRSVEARKQKALNPPEPKPVPLPTEPQTEVVRIARANVEKQLERIDEELDGNLDAKEWDMLTRAKDRLFKAWVHLISLPGPGVLKPSSARSRRQSSSFAPVEPEPPASQ